MGYKMYNLITESRIMLFISHLLVLPKSHKPQSYQIQVWVSQNCIFSLLYSSPESFYAPTLSGHTSQLLKLLTQKSSTKSNVIYPNSTPNSVRLFTQRGRSELVLFLVLISIISLCPTLYK